MEKETTAAAPAAQGAGGQQAAAQPAEQEQETAKAGAPAAGGTAKTYDQAYIDGLLARQQEAQEAAVAEALRVAGMDAESKEKYRREQADKKLEQREADLARRELKADARGVLEEKEIPAEFLDMLLGKDLKETQANADAFKTKFDAAVQAQVEKRLVGKTPQGGNGGAVSEEEAIAAEIRKYL